MCRLVGALLLFLWRDDPKDKREIVNDPMSGGWDGRDAGWRDEIGDGLILDTLCVFIVFDSFC